MFTVYIINYNIIQLIADSAVNYLLINYNIRKLKFYTTAEYIILLNI